LFWRFEDLTTFEIDKVQGERLPLPRCYTIVFVCSLLRKTFSTTPAFLLSHITKLFQDVSLASMFVSAKMHDTLKKPRELLAVVIAPRRRRRFRHDGSWRNCGISLLSVLFYIMSLDSRSRQMAIERLILETICFNFTSKMPFPYVIKVGKDLKGIFFLFSCLSFSDLWFSIQEIDQIRLANCHRLVRHPTYIYLFSAYLLHFVNFRLAIEPSFR